MTGAQASYLKTLTEQLGQQDEFSPTLNSAASFGSTIVCTSAAELEHGNPPSAQSKNLMLERKFHRSSRAGPFTLAKLGPGA